MSTLPRTSDVLYYRIHCTNVSIVLMYSLYHVHQPCPTSETCHAGVVFHSSHMHRMPYLYRSFSAKEPCNEWLFCEKRQSCKHIKAIINHTPNSYGKRKCQRSAFDSCNPARAMAAGLPRQNHVWITTNHFVRFNTTEFDEMLCQFGFQPLIVGLGASSAKGLEV